MRSIVAMYNDITIRKNNNKITKFYQALTGEAIVYAKSKNKCDKII